MKAIGKRLGKLEQRFGPHVQTEFERNLMALLEAGRRRVAESRAGEGLPERPFADNRNDLAGLSMIEILNRGRLRARERAIAETRTETSQQPEKEAT